MAPELHLLEKIKEAPLEDFPFPHLYLTDVFPTDFYQQIRDNLPAPELMGQIGDVRGSGKLRKYKERFAYLLPDHSDFWRDFCGWLGGGLFGRELMSALGIIRSGQRFKYDIHLVRDEPGYSLGPHTDAPKKVVTALFYLPRDGSLSHLGTSLYVPRDGLSDPTNKHHGFEGFHRVTTLPYLPNSLFAFARSDVSFHGVERTDGQRWSLTFQVQNA